MKTSIRIMMAALLGLLPLQAQNTFPVPPSGEESGVALQLPASKSWLELFYSSDLFNYSIDGLNPNSVAAADDNGVAKIMAVQVDGTADVKLIATQESNAISVRLVGTQPGKTYLVLSRGSFVSGAWAVEHTVIGAEGQIFTDTLVPMNGRPQLAIVAGSGEDSDGDGLPDAYETWVTRTTADLPDTGDTALSDGYKDADGDGWINLDEWRNSTDPSTWDAPPAPRLTLAHYTRIGPREVVSDRKTVSGHSEFSVRIHIR
jgi:hypothetical protein